MSRKPLYSDWYTYEQKKPEEPKKSTIKKEKEAVKESPLQKMREKLANQRSNSVAKED